MADHAAGFSARWPAGAQPARAVTPEPAPCPAPDDLLHAYPVGLAVNDVRNDSPELVAPRPDRIRATG